MEYTQIPLCHNDTKIKVILSTDTKFKTWNTQSYWCSSSFARNIWALYALNSPSWGFYADSVFQSRSSIVAQAGLNRIVGRAVQVTSPLTLNCWMNFLEELHSVTPQSCPPLFLTTLPRRILYPAGHFTLSDVTGRLVGTSCPQPAPLRHCVKSLPLPLWWSPWATGSSSLMELLPDKKLIAEIFLIHLSPFVTCVIWILGLILKRNPKKWGFSALFIKHKYLLFEIQQGKSLKLDIL